MTEETKEDKHTNLGDAKHAASAFAGMKNSLLSGGWTPNNLLDYGTLRALIAIAEQLRVANLIALEAAWGDSFAAAERVDSTLFDDHDFAPDIAAILGLGDDHE